MRIHIAKALLGLVLFGGNSVIAQAVPPERAVPARAAPPLVTIAENGRFQVVGTKVFDPQGREFIPIGYNMNGSNAFWPGATLPLVEATARGWRFNCVRLNCMIKEGPRWNVNNDLDTIIAAYTSRKIVVQLEAHDWTGIIPTGTDLDYAAAWWAEQARRYKDNPYVWFNLFNEPGDIGNVHEKNPFWVSSHQRVIRAVRDTGADNVIVLDGVAAGHDRGAFWDDKTRTKDENSAILTWGQRVQMLDGRKVPNITFSFHSYGWGVGDEFLADYIDRVYAKGLSLHMGECGWYGDEKNLDVPQSQAIRSAFRVCLDKGVGILAWHAQPGDGMGLLDKPYRLTDFDNPTNLGWIGRLFWEATRVRGYGLSPEVAAAPAANVAPIVAVGPPAQLFVNQAAPLSLTGSVSDDGLPAGSKIQVQWSKVSGPGEVSFASAAKSDTTARFSAPGDYKLRLIARDGELLRSGEISVAVGAAGAVNQRPVVDAGPDETRFMKSVAVIWMRGSVRDDGLPLAGKITTTWSKISGPGEVTFKDAGPSGGIKARIQGQPGEYVLRMTSGDGELSASDDVKITLMPIAATQE